MLDADLEAHNRKASYTRSRYEIDRQYTVLIICTDLDKGIKRLSATIGI